MGVACGGDGRVKAHTARTNGGFSRLDVTVALAVIAVFAALGFPAVQYARERSRRQSCAENLRRIGAALGQYHDSRASLPVAAFWHASGIPADKLDGEAWTGAITYQNWACLLLPYTENHELAGKFDAQSPAIDGKNAARTTELPLLTCSSDSYHRPDNQYTYHDPQGRKASFARGNYAINGGGHTLARYPGTSSAPAADGYRYEYDAASGQFQWYGSGIAGINKAFTFDDFENGLSTMVAVDEIRSGIHPIDPRGAWAFGQIASSITWGHGVTGDDGAPNNATTGADDILGCPQLHKLVGAETLIEARMPCVEYWDSNWQATARSMHPGGVQVLLADGSARFVADAVDRGVWHVMHSRLCPAKYLPESTLSRTNEAGFHDASAPVAAASAAGDASALPSTIVNSIGMRLSLLPAGAFTMGVPDAGAEGNIPPECPAHLVRLTRPFYIGTYEVTQAEYHAVMKQTPSWHVRGLGLPADAAASARLPVERVTWFDAAAFCRRLTAAAPERAAGLEYRLPTEAEWEYACRAGRDSPYQWSPEPDYRTGENAGNLKKEALQLLAAGSYPPNAWGLFDMRGNVYEWCADWFRRDYYATSPANDPGGPVSGCLRVVRGGDWLFVGEGCTINRRIAAPWQSDPYIGFRVVAEPVHGQEHLQPLAFAEREPRLTLAFCSSHRDPRQPELVELDVDRLNATPLNSPWGTAPTWSPDGEEIAYVNGPDIVILRPSTGETHNVTNGKFSSVVTPAWSPDGRAIAFASVDEEKHWIISTLDIAGTGARSLSVKGRESRSPAWSPDGSQLLFVIGKSSEWPEARLALMASDGTSKTLLFSRTVPFNAAPAWSPDGRRIAFADWGKAWEYRQLVIANMDGEIERKLTYDYGYACYPAWSPDGNAIAYIEFHRDPTPDDVRGDLIVYDLEHETARTLSVGTAPRWEHARPAWRPVSDKGASVANREKNE